MRQQRSAERMVEACQSWSLAQMEQAQEHRACLEASSRKGAALAGQWQQEGLEWALAA
jgi:hypothetical protein